jgi:hypothetical protein
MIKAQFFVQGSSPYNAHVTILQYVFYVMPDKRVTVTLFDPVASDDVVEQRLHACFGEAMTEADRVLAPYGLCLTDGV